MNRPLDISRLAGRPVAAQATGAPAAAPREEIDAAALLAALWRGKWTIALLCALALALASVWVWRIATPIHASTATIALQPQEPSFGTDLESVLSGAGTDTAALNTETVVLRSRRLAGALVDRLDLVADPEFNAALRPPGRLDIALAAASARLGLAPREEVALSETEIRGRVIDALLDAVRAVNLRQTHAFEIEVRTRDPLKSARIANALAEIYIADQLAFKFEAGRVATEFLTGRAAQLREQMSALEAELSAFREASSLVSPELLAAQSRQLKDQRERITALRDEGRVGRARLAAWSEHLAAGRLRRLAEESGDEALGRAVARSPDSSRAREAARTLLARVEADLADDTATLEALVASEADLAREITLQSGDLVELRRIERELETTRLSHESFLTRLKEADVQQGLTTADARILSEAVPRPPVSPREALTLGLAGLMGLLGGAGLVAAREFGLSGIRTVDELRAHGGRTVLGSIPLMPGRARRDVLRHLRERPASLAAEAFRNLRTSVLMSDLDAPPRVVAVTSSVPGEGKTTTSLALAQTMAGCDGASVLLIEGDMRRRTLTGHVDGTDALGLVDAMRDPGLLAPGEHGAVKTGVDVLTGTDARVNAADLFASARFRRLVAEARLLYDLVVIDTPPVLVVPDARIIGREADAILYVVRWESTTRTQLRQGLEMFSSIGLRVAGTVLSQVDGRRMRAYGLGDYGYGDRRAGYHQR